MNRLRTIKLLLFILAFCSCAVSKLSSEKCNDFRFGKYTHNVYNKSGLGHWTKLTYTMTRNDSVEIVTSSHFPTDTAIYQIMWVGPCEYRSTRLNPQTDLDSFLIRQNSTGYRHKILNSTEEYFILKNYERKDTIWRVR